MTISSTTLRKEFDGNGVTTSFAFPYRFLADADLKVYVDDELQTLTTDYAVTGAGGPSGGNVVFSVAPASGTSNVIVLNDPAITQPLDLVENDPLPAEEVEKSLDRLTIISQRNRDLIDRSFRLPDTVASSVSTELPTPEANALIGWNETASALQNVDIVDLVTAATYGTAKADVFSGDGTTTDFTLTASPGALNNLDVSVAGVTQRPGIDYSWLGGTEINFASAPPSGTDNVLVRYMEALPQGTVDTAAVIYTPAGTGAVSTDIQSKLRERVSAFDFMTAAQIADVQGRTALLNVSTALQAAIDAAHAAGAELFLPAGTYLCVDLKMYSLDRIVFDAGAILKQSADGVVLKTRNNTTDTYVTGNVIRPQIIYPRIDMDNKLGFGILIEGCTNALVDNARITNVGSGSHNYNDGVANDSYTTYGIALKGVSGVRGTYYCRVVHPRISGTVATGNGGIYLGTTASLTDSRANFNQVVQPVFQTLGIGLSINLGGDNYIIQPEASLCDEGIRVGRTSGSTASRRNHIKMPYVESCTTYGLNLTSNALDTIIDGIGSTSGTTTPLNDSGANTSFFNANSDTYTEGFVRPYKGSMRFPATQVSDSNPNALDDYEEASPTPAIAGTTSAGTGTYSIQSGRVTKIGRLVHIDIALSWTAHTGTGDLKITGLPFEAQSNSPLSVYIQSGFPLSGGPVFQARTTMGSSEIMLSQYNGTTVAAIPMDTSANIQVSGTYISAT